MKYCFVCGKQLGAGESCGCFPMNFCHKCGVRLEDSKPCFCQTVIPGSKMVKIAGIILAIFGALFIVSDSMSMKAMAVAMLLCGIISIVFCQKREKADIIIFSGIAAAVMPIAAPMIFPIIEDETLAEAAEVAQEAAEAVALATSDLLAILFAITIMFGLPILVIVGGIKMKNSI